MSLTNLTIHKYNRNGPTTDVSLNIAKNNHTEGILFRITRNTFTFPGTAC